MKGFSMKRASYASLFLTTALSLAPLVASAHTAPPPPPPPHEMSDLVVSRIVVNTDRKTPNPPALSTLATMEGATGVQIADNAYLTTANFGPHAFDGTDITIKNVSMTRSRLPEAGGSNLLTLDDGISFDRKGNPVKPTDTGDIGGVYVYDINNARFGSLVNVVLTDRSNMDVNSIVYPAKASFRGVTLSKNATLIVTSPTDPNTFYTIRIEPGHRPMFGGPPGNPFGPPGPPPFAAGHHFHK